ncbi:hypothetical protein QBC39DRAFT_353348 [Podospora conica]|nr:hypothetical protein QBC39DRAFT_353348 [Schizothecium conicum]
MFWVYIAHYVSPKPPNDGFPRDVGAAADPCGKVAVAVARFLHEAIPIGSTMSTIITSMVPNSGHKDGVMVIEAKRAAHRRRPEQAAAGRIVSSSQSLDLCPPSPNQSGPSWIESHLCVSRAPAGLGLGPIDWSLSSALSLVYRPEVDLVVVAVPELEVWIGAAFTFFHIRCSVSLCFRRALVSNDVLKKHRKQRKRNSKRRRRILDVAVDHSEEVL